MSAAQLLHLFSNCIFIPTIAVMVLGYITVKTYWLLLCIVYAFDAIGYGMQQHWTHSVIDWLFTFVMYVLWKKWPDDNDKPRKRRAALLAKVLPKPDATPVRVGISVVR